MRLCPIRCQQRLRGRLNRGSAVPYTLLRGQFVIRYLHSAATEAAPQ